MIKHFIAFCCILFICSTVFAETPVSNFADSIDNANGTKTLNVYSYPKYYADGQGLQEAQTTFDVSQDPSWNWEVSRNVYKLKVKSDGTFQINHLGDIFSQKIIGIGFFNSNTKEHIVKNTPALSNPIVSGNEIEWSLPLGITYKLVYSNDDFKDVLTLSQQAKDWLIARKPAGWTAQNTWIALIYDMDLSQSSMIESKDFETEDDIGFAKDGRIKHRIKKSIVKHSNFSEINNPTLQWSKKKFYRNGKYVEAIPVTALDSENGSLVFNTDITFQEGVSGYSGTDDARLRASSPDTNYGTDGQVYVTGTGSVLIKFDLSSISGATINTAVLWIYCSDRSGQDNFNIWRMIRGWTESTVTYNKYDGTNAWGTAGANNSTTDYTTTNAVSALNGNAEWRNYTVTSLIQDIMANSNYGLKIQQSNTGGVYCGIYTSEYTVDTAKRPYLTINYTAGEAARRRGPIVLN